MVAGATIAAGVVQHRRGLAHQRQPADLENVRGALDDAAALHRVASVLDEVQLWLVQMGKRFFDTEKGLAICKDLVGVGRECDALGERLAVRLRRDHDAVRAFTSANESVLAIYRALGIIKLELETPPNPSAVAQVEKIVREKRNAIDTQREAFDQRRSDFVDLAARTAGAKLPTA